MTAELIERIEAADGPDRELDVLIDEAAGNPVVEPNSPALRANWPQRKSGLTVPRYTASIDAATTLVPEGWDWGGHSDDCFFVFKRRSGNRYGPLFDATASTPALALCAAALKAREE